MEELRRLVASDRRRVELDHTDWLDDRRMPASVDRRRRCRLSLRSGPGAPRSRSARKRVSPQRRPRSADPAADETLVARLLLEYVRDMASSMGLASAGGDAGGGPALRTGDGACKNPGKTASLACVVASIFKPSTPPGPYQFSWAS